MQDFATELNRMLELSGKSITTVAELSRVDRAYLSRLLTGDKTNPSPDVLVRLWIGVIFDQRLLARDPELIWGLERLALSLLWTNAPDKLVAGVANTRLISTR